MPSARDRRPKPYDALAPKVLVAARGSHYDRLVAAAAAVRSAEDHLARVVQEAYEAGDSWTVIGAALGVSRQAAQQRFGRLR
jgi:hypothetical protein